MDEPDNDSFEEWNEKRKETSILDTYLAICGNDNVKKQLACVAFDDPDKYPEEYAAVVDVVKKHKELADIVVDYKQTKRAYRIALAESHKEALWKQDEIMQHTLKKSFNEACNEEQARIQLNFEELKNSQPVEVLYEDMDELMIESEEGSDEHSSIE
jgi:hypothetical protein